MQRNSIIMTKHYQVRRRWNNTWKKVTMVLASVVVFATTYALILPAITMEPEYICGKEAHLHSEACYQIPEASTVSSLICTSNTLGIHEHTDECYNENSELKCGIANFVLHTHNSDCLDVNGDLVCSLPEIKTHIHNASCWQQPHVHEEACYIQQRGNLICTVEEGSVHDHNDTCYTQQEHLTCTLAEIEPHTHTTEACYAETKTLLCAEPVVQPHTHSDACYTVTQTTVCDLEESESHSHESGCYGEDNSLVCTLPEVVGHTHAGACFQTSSVLTCTLTETAGHLHSDTCYSEPVYTLTCKEEETEGHLHGETCRETVSVLTCALEAGIAHQHTDACFVCTSVLQCQEPVAEDAVRTLNCTETEIFPHNHEAACFDASGACICGLLQVSEHIHNENCFAITMEQTAEPVLMCGYEEEHEHGEECVATEETDEILTGDALIAEGYYCGIAEHLHQDEACRDENGDVMCTMTEHTHVTQCRSDRTAVETAEEWEATLPDELTGNIAADLIAVAESQIGEGQIEENFIVEDDEQMFYSRYADWWSQGENPYGDWNAKFVSFCLYYADIDFPTDVDVDEWANVNQWAEALKDSEYRLSEEVLPIPADLVFLANGRMGIVTAVDAENGTLDAILEWYGEVQEKTFDLNQDVLMTVRIPGNPPMMMMSARSNADVINVIAMIEAMPSANQVDALIARYDETESDEDLAAYMAAVEQVNETYRNYAALTEDERTLVENADKLMELEYVWSQITLATTYSAGKRSGDKKVVSGEEITFKLFDYSIRINKKAATGNAWRENERFFNFRDTERKTGPDGKTSFITNPIGGTTPETAYVTHNKNQYHDADGFTKAHATVLPTLDQNGNPTLDLSLYANGKANADTEYTNATVPENIRSLAYLFSEGDHAVTAYYPTNTILQKNGNHYWYNSRENAVDYDTTNNLFRVRKYAERNEITAKIEAGGHCDGAYDFLPFTYTGGKTVGTWENSGEEYHVAYNATDGYNVNYWFGMTMELSFYQTKGGKLDDEDMIFSFSGDDDVWVFVDDVLVLDLGGTHGTATGSINFATGEVKQYLSWKNGTESDTATSFPTTIRKRFKAAGKLNDVAWSSSKKTFADYTTHTLKLFYMERGAGVANCNIDFLLPTLPNKSLTVSKNLVADGDAATTDFLKDTLSYKFRVVKADTDGNATEKLFIKPNTKYTIKEGNTETGTGTVDANGYFTLKHGQSALFTDMLGQGGGATKYIVQEIVPSDLKGQYGGIEYMANGTTGTTKGEDGKIQNFTTYSTGALSAEIAQTVTYYNKVDTAELSQLQLTKRLAPGAGFDPGKEFQIQVKLGGELLPVGTKYWIDNEAYEVATAGIVKLKKDQTATIQGILSGTTYEITELDAGTGSFNASYSGTVTDSAGKTTDLSLTGGSVSGEFPLSSIVHIIVTNADYDFAGEIPIYKQVPYNSETATFHFLAEQVEQDETGTWQTVKQVPGTSITVSADEKQGGIVTVGYKTGESVDYYYKIWEQAGDDDSFLYDDSFYIVEVNVSGNSATIGKILKNGTKDAGKILFVNHKSTSLTVTKKVVGVEGDFGPFAFRATVTLNGKPFTLAEPADKNYTVSGNEATFTLSDKGSISITGIPYGAEVTVTETQHDGFIAKYQVGDGQLVAGDSAEIEIVTSSQTVHFENHVSYELPETGGIGTASWYYVSGGTLLTISTLWRKMRRYRGRRVDGG